MATSEPRPSRRPQPSVTSGEKQHALFLWIYMQPLADPVSAARIVARLQDHTEIVCPPSSTSEKEAILAGVGFGKEFYSKVTRQAPLKAFHMLTRKHEEANLPATGGDIFIHAKSDTYSKLFELCQQLIGNLGKMVKKFEDVYGFTYLGGRDLSGFPYGLANPETPGDRSLVAVEGRTGGSYVLTQRWEHLMEQIHGARQSTMEAWIGRHQDDGAELAQMHLQSHVSRMRGGNSPGMTPHVNVLRQGMPYGSQGGKCGLFFLAYSNDPGDFEYLLERMGGYGRDGHIDFIFRLSRCVSGNLWYFPGMEELERLASMPDAAQRSVRY